MQNGQLYWEPQQSLRSRLNSRIRATLRGRYTLEGVAPDFTSGLLLGYDDLPYLEGLRDADMPQADELVEAIQKHQVIRVYDADCV